VGCRVEGLGSRVQYLGFRVQGLMYGGQGLGLRVASMSGIAHTSHPISRRKSTRAEDGLLTAARTCHDGGGRLRVQGSGFRVQRPGFRVQRPGLIVHC